MGLFSLNPQEAHDIIKSRINSTFYNTNLPDDQAQLLKAVVQNEFAFFKILDFRFIPHSLFQEGIHRILYRFDENLFNKIPEMFTSVELARKIVTLDQQMSLSLFNISVQRNEELDTKIKMLKYLKDNILLEKNDEYKYQLDKTWLYASLDTFPEFKIDYIALNIQTLINNILFDEILKSVSQQKPSINDIKLLNEQFYKYINEKDINVFKIIEIKNYVLNEDIKDSDIEKIRNELIKPFSDFCEVKFTDNKFSFKEFELKDSEKDIEGL